MKPPWLVLALGALAGVLAFAATFWMQTHDQPRDSRSPGAELEWLRREFGLSDPTFERVAALHRAYKPTCAELCRRIEERNERLREAVSRTNVMTPEIRGLVIETGRVRDECRQAMLEHLYAVAGAMPTEAGNRYLQVMLGATCILQEARPIDTIHPGMSSPGGGHGHHE